jgi:hypothetical protein
MKIDPYQHQESWVRWKKKVHELGFIPEISRVNSSIILRYLTDMELGINTSLSSTKGATSFPTMRKQAKFDLKIHRYFFNFIFDKIKN